MIKVEYINNVFMHVSSDEEGLLWDIQEKFSFYAPNYRFHPKYKAKFWDGKIRLFSPYNQKLYIGLLDELRTWCYNNKIPLVIDPMLDNDRDITQEDVVDFVKTLNLPFTPYPHQYVGIYHSLKKRRTTLLSNTSSGKSLIIYALSRYLQQHKTGKILIIVPTVTLVSQMYGDFDDYAKTVKWTAEDNVHKIMSGTDKNADKKIYVSTWQSLTKMPISYFDQFDTVIADEAHTAQALSITKILEKCNASDRIGMTGTFDDAKANQFQIQGLLGARKQLTTYEDLANQGIIANLNINIVNINHSATDRKIVRLQHKGYQDEIAYILNMKKRNTFICNMANKFEGNTLILFLKIDHGKELKRILDEKVKKTGKQVHLVYGKIKADVREEVRRISEENDNVIIVASYPTMSTGTNIKRLSNVIFASPNKSKIRTLQSIGRSLRLHHTKNMAQLYDIVDDFSHKSYKNYALKHFVKRFKYYADEKFNYKMINIDF